MALEISNIVNKTITTESIISKVTYLSFPRLEEYIKTLIELKINVVPIKIVLTQISIRYDIFGITN